MLIGKGHCLFWISASNNRLDSLFKTLFYYQSARVPVGTIDQKIIHGVKVIIKELSASTSHLIRTFLLMNQESCLFHI